MSKLGLRTRMPDMLGSPTYLSCARCGGAPSNKTYSAPEFLFRLRKDIIRDLLSQVPAFNKAYA